MTNKCIKDLAIVGDTAHIKIAEIGTDKIIAEFDSPSFANTEERRQKNELSCYISGTHGNA